MTIGGIFSVQVTSAQAAPTTAPLVVNRRTIQQPLLVPTLGMHALPLAVISAGLIIKPPIAAIVLRAPYCGPTLCVSTIY